MTTPTAATMLSSAGRGLLPELTGGEVEENTALLSFRGTNTLQMFPSQQDEHTWRDTF